MHQQPSKRTVCTVSSFCILLTRRAIHFHPLNELPSAPLATSSEGVLATLVAAREWAEQCGEVGRGGESC